MNFKIALKSVIRHKWSSLVMLSVFAVAAFVAFWVFGFSNTFSSHVSGDIRAYDGDITVSVNFNKKDKMKEILSKDKNIYKIEYETRIKAVMSSKRVNGMLRLGELTDSNISKYSKIKLEEGRLPKAPNEIVISTFHNPSKLKAGDSIFITTFTPEKVINATQLKVVGVGKLRTNSLVTHEGMAALMNSTEYANTVIIYNSQDIPEKTKVAETVVNTKAVLKANGIEVKEVEDYFTQMKQLQILVVVFNGLKIIMLGIMFPLIGAVLGAIVWIHVYKRRKELWTYSSIGMKDKSLTNLMLIEYWIIGLAGMVIGLIGGGVSSYFAEASGARVYFQFLMDLPMTSTIGIADVLIILAFVFVCILAWATPPIRKIVKAKPFSY